jgi:hypothetical protein
VSGAVPLAQGKGEGGSTVLPVKPSNTARQTPSVTAPAVATLVPPAGNTPGAGASNTTHGTNTGITNTMAVSQTSSSVSDAASIVTPASPVVSLRPSWADETEEVRSGPTIQMESIFSSGPPAEVTGTPLRSRSPDSQPKRKKLNTHSRFDALRDISFDDNMSSEDEQ